MKHVKRSHLRNHHWPNFPGGNNITGCNPLNINICCDKIGFKKQGKIAHSTRHQSGSPTHLLLLQIHVSWGNRLQDTRTIFKKNYYPLFTTDIYLPVLGAMVSLPVKVQGDVVMSKEAGAPSATQTSAIGSPCMYSIPLGHCWDTHQKKEKKTFLISAQVGVSPICLEGFSNSYLFL